MTRDAQRVGCRWDKEEKKPETRNSKLEDDPGREMINRAWQYNGLSSDGPAYDRNNVGVGGTGSVLALGLPGLQVRVCVLCKGREGREGRGSDTGQVENRPRIEKGFKVGDVEQAGETGVGKLEGEGTKLESKCQDFRYLLWRFVRRPSDRKRVGLAVTGTLEGNLRWPNRQPHSESAHVAHVPGMESPRNTLAA